MFVFSIGMCLRISSFCFAFFFGFSVSSKSLIINILLDSLIKTQKIPKLLFLWSLFIFLISVLMFNISMLLLTLPFFSLPFDCWVLGPFLLLSGTEVLSWFLLTPFTIFGRVNSPLSFSTGLCFGFRDGVDPEELTVVKNFSRAGSNPCWTTSALLFRFVLGLLFFDSISFCWSWIIWSRRLSWFWRKDIWRALCLAIVSMSFSFCW